MSRLAVLLVACTGMRPAVEQAQPEIAARSAVPRGDVQTLGEGCYAVGDVVWTCSIDSLPAGERVCSIEPEWPWVVSEMFVSKKRNGVWEHGFSDANLDSFIALQNTRRCHDRWYGSFVTEPFGLSIEDAAPARPSKRTHFVRYAELGLEGVSIAAEPLDGIAAWSLCRGGGPVPAQRERVSVCVDHDGRVRQGIEIYRGGQGNERAFGLPEAPCCETRAPAFRTDPVFEEARTAVRPPEGTLWTCAVIDLVAHDIRCHRADPDRPRGEPAAVYTSR